VAEQNLGRAASDYIATVLLVSEAPEDQYVDPSNLRAQLMGRLDEISAHPAAAGLEQQELDDAKFALVAWTDETLMLSDWAGREVWGHDLLQFSLFRTNRGGDEFYERLARLRPDQNAARLIFYLCFCFGFQGQLLGEDHQRMALIQQNFDILRAAGHATDLVTQGELSREAYNLEVNLEPPSSGTVLKVILRWGGGALVLFGLLWAVLAFMASRVALPPGA
jgi:type IV/VI secretion system ImpK/VasF family protein